MIMINDDIFLHLLWVVSSDRYIPTNTFINVKVAKEIIVAIVIPLSLAIVMGQAYLRDITLILLRSIIIISKLL